MKLSNTMIFEVNTVRHRLPANQPACLPAVRPSSTSAVALDFSQKKGNQSSLLSSTFFLSLLLSYKKVRNSQRGIDRLSWLLIKSHTKTVACICEHIYEYTPLPI